MPTPTYIPLATITLTTTDSQIVFSSIPATYRDLILVVDASYSAATSLRVRLNSDTGSNYPVVWMGNLENSTYTLANTYDYLRPEFTDPAAGSRRAYTFQFLDYSATNKHKTALSRVSAGATVVVAGAHRWANTSAINTILLFLGSGNFQVGSTFSLYGIA
jgi:hypothetical protein